MDREASPPLAGVSPDEVTLADVSPTEIDAALASTTPLVAQRGLDVCESLAAADVDTVDPFLDDVADLAESENAAIAMRAIATLEVVAERDTRTLDPYVAALVDAAGAPVVEVQERASACLATVAIAEPELLASHVPALANALRATEPADATQPADATGGRPGDPAPVDPATRRTLDERANAEREQRRSARERLGNVVVAVTEQTVVEDPDAAVVAATSLLDDEQATVVGCAIDALRELAETAPAVVEPATDDVRACLTHDAAFVRARSVHALGTIGSDADLDALRDLAANDPDDGVRDLAAATTDHLHGD